jgi:hypothetical protein
VKVTWLDPDGLVTVRYCVPNVWFAAVAAKLRLGDVEVPPFAVTMTLFAAPDPAPTMRLTLMVCVTPLAVSETVPLTLEFAGKPAGFPLIVRVWGVTALPAGETLNQVTPLYVPEEAMLNEVLAVAFTVTC